jgi:flagellar biogenesis protein FliO
MQLFALIVLLVAGAYAGRRLLRARAEDASPLRILARAGLTPKSGLALVEADGRTLLVGYGGEGAPVLLEHPSVAAPASRPVALPPARPVVEPATRPHPAPPVPEIVLEDLVEIAPPPSASA